MKLTEYVVASRGLHRHIVAHGLDPEQVIAVDYSDLSGLIVHVSSSVLPAWLATLTDRVVTRLTDLDGGDIHYDTAGLIDGVPVRIVAVACASKSWTAVTT